MTSESLKSQPEYQKSEPPRAAEASSSTVPPSTDARWRGRLSGQVTLCVCPWIASSAAAMPHPGMQGIHPSSAQQLQGHSLSIVLLALNRLFL